MLAAAFGFGVFTLTDMHERTAHLGLTEPRLAGRANAGQRVLPRFVAGLLPVAVANHVISGSASEVPCTVDAEVHAHPLVALEAEKELLAHRPRIAHEPPVELGGTSRKPTLRAGDLGAQSNK